MSDFEKKSLKEAAQERGGEYVPVESTLSQTVFNEILANQQLKKIGDTPPTGITGINFLKYVLECFGRKAFVAMVKNWTICVNRKDSEWIRKQLLLHRYRPSKRRKLTNIYSLSLHNK